MTLKYPGAYYGLDFQLLSGGTANGCFAGTVVRCLNVAAVNRVDKIVPKRTGGRVESPLKSRPSVKTVVVVVLKLHKG